jgi:hypothetical protein
MSNSTRASEVPPSSLKDRTPKRLMKLSSLLLCLSLSGSAYAAVNGSWVLNGSTVAYDGANQLRIGEGEVNVNNANAQLAAAIGVNVAAPAGIIWAGPNAGTCPLSTANLLANNEAFYVYYAPTTTQLVASPVPPTEVGIPSGNLFFNPGGGVMAERPPRTTSTLARLSQGPRERSFRSRDMAIRFFSSMEEFHQRFPSRSTRPMGSLGHMSLHWRLHGSGRPPRPDCI